MGEQLKKEWLRNAIRENLGERRLAEIESMSDPTPDPILSADFINNYFRLAHWHDVADSHEALRAERDNLALTVEEDAIYLRTAEAALEAETRRTGGIEDELEYVYTVLSDETRRADEAEQRIADLEAALARIDKECPA